MESTVPSKKAKLGAVSGVYIPVVLNIISILMFLRFGSILGRIGLLGILGLLAIAYFVDFVTTLSLSAIASNGEVKGGGAYYLISRSLGPEFGGSIGVLFYLAQVLNTALNVVGLIDCLRLNLAAVIPRGYWEGYLMETCALVFCTVLCLAGSGIFAKASNGLLVVLLISTLSIPVSAITRHPFKNAELSVEFTGMSARTLLSNLYPAKFPHYSGSETFRELFGVLFPATSGIFAGASMSGDLRNPIILSMASSVTHQSFLHHTNILSTTSVWSPLILAGECATTFFSALMGLVGSAKLLQALARDRLLPGLSIFGHGTTHGDEPIYAVLLTYFIAQIALFADLNQIATLIAMGYQMTFFVMNLACFLLKIGSAPNFRPAFKFFGWESALIGSLLSAAAMFFIDETYAATAICLLFFLFLIIHYMSPPKHWGDVSQNLIYHQVRKYLLRLKPEHIKFWRPQIILLINNPRHHTRLIQFCNSMKKGALYILGHVIVTDDFDTGIHEAKLQQSAWTRYISEFSRIKAFVQLTMSPTIEWGVRNLILSAGLGGMRPNIAILGFYNMEELRMLQPTIHVPSAPVSPSKAKFEQSAGVGTTRRRRRGDTSARLLESSLPTDSIRTEGMMSVTSYVTILSDLALRHRLNVAIGKGFQSLETPRHDGSNMKKYVDLWPIQMSAEITAEGKNVLTTNFDTYTLILQLGYILLSVPNWKKAFKLRILVFVEYDTEVDEERARLKALLEKLRIEAEVRVSWLASGELATYNYIVNGKSSGETDYAVNKLLEGDEWWRELQNIRQEASRSQDISTFGELLEISKRRGSSPNTEITGPLGHLGTDKMLGLPKKSTVSKIARLGANFGIHTNHLEASVLEDETNQLVYDHSDDEGSSSSDGDLNDIASEGDAEQDSPQNQPLLHFGRRKSHGDLLRHPHSRNPQRGGDSRGNVRDYGATKSVPSFTKTDRSSITPTESFKRSGSTQALLGRPAEVARTGTDPDTTAKRPTRPPMSRNSSMGKFSSRPVPQTRVQSEEGGEQRLMFAEEVEPVRTPFIRSRRNSNSQTASSSDLHLNIPDIMDSFHFGPTDDAEARSNYSTQSLPLSFNDLPSRAQHMILNELMRQNSEDTAVLLTTLPIPEEGTSKSEETSLRYLCDIEVLCHELPPVLLVLSNNMTVTVSLTSDSGGQSPRSPTHPSASSRFRGIRGNLRHKRLHSQKALTPATAPTASEASLKTSITKHQQQAPDAVRPRLYGSLSSPHAEESERIAQSRRLMDDLDTAYYAHKNPPWSDVWFKPSSWAHPIRVDNVKKNSHVASGTPKKPPPSSSSMIKESPAPRDRREIDTRGIDSREKPSHTRKPSVASSSRTSSTKMSTISMGPQSIVIGFDSPFLQDKSRWTPTTPGNTELAGLATPDIIDVSTPIHIRYHDTLNAAYEDIPLLPSTVYRRESAGLAYTASIVRPDTAPPDLPLPRPPTPAVSTIPDSPSETDSDEFHRDSIWEDDIPSTADVPILTPHTGVSTLAGTDVFTPIDQALPGTPGLLCPGCRIGGQTPGVSARNAPRDEHRGSLHYPEERESGFCNSCRDGDLLPDISRFSVIEPEDATLIGSEENQGSQPGLGIVRNEIEVMEDQAGNIKPRALGSKFRLGATKDSKLANRRQLDIEVAPSRPGSAPPERRPSTGHILEHSAQNKSAESPSSDYEEPPSANEALQQLGAPPSHFSLNSKVLSRPLRLSTQVVERSLSRSNARNRRSPHYHGRTGHISNQINSGLEDWETDIFKDYGAMTPIDIPKVPFSPLRALVNSPRLTLTEKARASLEKAKLDTPITEQMEPEQETPRTQMYNLYRRANGDF
ncbi:putative Amino acid permease-domain-containing protein [Seiridium cardinale]|uniref:Amino acid permease-domain-containing protein n=1 Tax=Seiridium cardinale TaxID=138064 RepID=A0ABR2XVT6_9PEZI